MPRTNLKVVATLVSALLVGLILAACGDATPTTQPVPVTPTPTSVPATTAPATTTSANPTATTTTAVIPTATPLPPTAAPATSVPATTASVTTSAPATTAPATTANNTPGAAFNLNSVDVSKNIYLDNRSNALEVVRSFYNAINLKEYVRAYSYWGVPGEANPSGVQPYPDFEKGYANTASVELSAGPVLSAGAAAGSAYYRVPVLLKATNTGGSAQTFAGCYLVRQSNPANFGAPPFHPMRFEKASIKPVNGNGEVNQAIAEGCETNSSGTNSVVTFPPTGNPPAIDASRFVDDRSDPAQVLRSFYNAINRKEYVRAYSYWKDSAVSGGQVQPYPQFEQGYQTTASVQLAVGKFTGDPGAGQIYYSVPVALVSHLIGDRVQTFVGCYTLHQSRPAIFGAPPFVPLGITKGDFKEVPANTDTNALLAQATTMCK